ncbi:reverse transcriptase N-terminal domain-containing protein [Bacillus cereus]|uniref:reverse transcriptase N-terminal domain-containing protein n=1 Tax=Bacillus cereus TaxID=1396 RepID=UPI001E653B62|nr:reverse transcriptase N-terminal domain-containing protein [Bacillus cereus]
MYRAEQLGQRRKAKGLQCFLMGSEEALFISIRQVTQLNKGKRTVGEMVSKPLIQLKG